jgi:alpha-L-rhamnosidase
MKLFFRKYFFVSLLCLLLFICNIYSQNIIVPANNRVVNYLVQPYKPLTATKSAGSTKINSPDPLVNYKWQQPAATDLLESYTLLPKKIRIENNAAQLIAEAKSSVVNITGNGIIKIDFGVVSPGWIEFDAMGLPEQTLAAIGTQPISPNKKDTLKKYGNTYRLELNPQLYEGVRYAWIYIDHFSTPFTIKNIKLVCQAKPVNYTGSFSCSNEVVTKMWYTGAYTVRACYQQDYMGTILDDRGDRVSFTGDAHVAQAASLVAFSNYDFIKKNLDNTSNVNDPSGIASYPLYWILSAADYYRYTADTVALSGYIKNATLILEQAYKMYETNFSQSWFGWDQRLGGGFEFPNSDETRNGYRMLAIRAWLQFANVMDEYGRNDLKTKFQQYADEKIAWLRRDKEWPRSFGMYANVYAVNAGFTNRDEQELIYQLFFTNRVNRNFLSPFHEYFVLQSLATLHKYNDALGAAFDCWGGQLKDGATTFYELYRPEFNAVLPHQSILNCSLCHPWSGGITKWLTEEVAGIKPLLPGFKTFVAAPHVSNKISWVKAITNTVHGNISISMNINTGNGLLKVPHNTTCNFGVPKAGKKIKSISINNKIIWDNNTHNKQNEVDDEEDFMYIKNILPGRHIIKVVYQGKPPVYKDYPKIYAASFIKEDTATFNNNIKQYGKKGYVLFCEKQIAQLPSFINSVTVLKDNGPVFKILDEDTTGKKMLIDSITNCIVETNKNAHSIWIKIDVNSITNFKMCIYLPANKSQAGNTPIEIYDGKNLQLIAPTKVAHNTIKASYMLYKYNSSCYIRIYRGATTGIFFD